MGLFVESRDLVHDYILTWGTVKFLPLSRPLSIHSRLGLRIKRERHTKGINLVRRKLAMQWVRRKKERGTAGSLTSHDHMLTQTWRQISLSMAFVAKFKSPIWSFSGSAENWKLKETLAFYFLSSSSFQPLSLSLSDQVREDRSRPRGCHVRVCS